MDEGYFLLPFVGLHAAEVAYEQIVSQGAECELVVTPTVFECFQNEPQYAELIEEMVATDRLRIFETTSGLPFPIGITDAHAQIIAAEGDQPKAYLETDREEVYQWVKDRFETQKAQATLVTPTLTL